MFWAAVLTAAIDVSAMPARELARVPSPQVQAQTAALSVGQALKHESQRVVSGTVNTHSQFDASWRRGDDSFSPSSRGSLVNGQAAGHDAMAANADRTFDVAQGVIFFSVCFSAGAPKPQAGDNITAEHSPIIMPDPRAESRHSLTYVSMRTSLRLPSIGHRGARSGLDSLLPAWASAGERVHPFIQQHAVLGAHSAPLTPCVGPAFLAVARSFALAGQGTTPMAPSTLTRAPTTDIVLASVPQSRFSRA